MNAWLKGSLDVEITNVFQRLEKVLLLLNDGCGGNDLVETKRKVTDTFKFYFIKTWYILQKLAWTLVLTDWMLMLMVMVTKQKLSETLFKSE